MSRQFKVKLAAEATPIGYVYVEAETAEDARAIVEARIDDEDDGFDDVDFEPESIDYVRIRGVEEVKVSTFDPNAARAAGSPYQAMCDGEDERRGLPLKTSVDVLVETVDGETHDDAFGGEKP